MARQRRLCLLSLLGVCVFTGFCKWTTKAGTTSSEQPFEVLRYTVDSFVSDTSPQTQNKAQGRFARLSEDASQVFLYIEPPFSIYAFEKQNSEWDNQGLIFRCLSPRPYADIIMKFDVSSSGRTAVASCTDVDVDFNVTRRTIHVLEKNGTRSWVSRLIDRFVSPRINKICGYDFATALSASSDGGTVVVSTWETGRDENKCNRVGRVYTKSDDNMWNHAAKIVIASLYVSPRDVSLSGDGHTLAMSFNPDLRSEKDCYAIVIYRRDRNGRWRRQALLVDAYASAGDVFGMGLALSGAGDDLLVGVGNKHDNTGRAILYTRSGVGRWYQTANLAPSEKIEHSRLGPSVSLSEDGNIAVICSPWRFSTGACWVFARIQEVWLQQGQPYTPASLSPQYPQAISYGFGMTVRLTPSGSAFIVTGYNNVPCGDCWNKGGGGVIFRRNTLTLMNN